MWSWLQSEMPPPRSQSLLASAPIGWCIVVWGDTVDWDQQLRLWRMFVLRMLPFYLKLNYILSFKSPDLNINAFCLGCFDLVFLNLQLHSNTLPCKKLHLNDTPQQWFHETFKVCKDFSRNFIDLGRFPRSLGCWLPVFDMLCDDKLSERCYW